MHPHADALGLVHIGRADALLGGADVVAAARLLGERVQLKVPRQDAVAACVDIQLVYGYVLLDQSVDLTQNRLRIDNDARSDDVDAVRIQDTGRDQLQLVLFGAYHNGMACVVAALRTNNQIGLGREDINVLALAFVAPLSTKNNFTRHW